MFLKTIAFVNVTYLFKDYPDLMELFAGQDNAPFTWGDNAYSLITKEVFLNNIGEIVANNDYSPEKHKQFIEHVDSSCLGTRVYINLED
jgi:hypothetical protein